MNIEPCVRFGIRISPKISEKPADSRNNRPPNVTLLTVSSTQNVISALQLSYPASGGMLLYSALGQRRIIARVDGMREELLFRPSPELADVLVGLDGLVPELEPVFGAFRYHASEVDIADYVVEVIELERPAWRVGEADRLQRGHQLFLVACVAADHLEAGVQHLAVSVKQRRVLTGDGVEIL